jgi:S1-C subfamily serine protease
MTAIVGEGVGGPIRAQVTRGQKLMLGSTSVTFPVLFLSLQKSGAFSDPELAGNVGDGVFSRFNTTFDYSRRQVYFEPVSNYGLGDSLKLMVVKRGIVGLEVLSVLPGGPLAEAGLKRDDIIESIDYRDAVRIDDPMLQRIFRRPAGTRIPMTIRSDGDLKHIVVILGETV